MRKSGILMHLTSLPGPHGIGSMGKAAFEFVDFLRGAGQHCWQILPLSPTGYGDSPYQSCSTFAGNHYLIDLEKLVNDGLLTEQDLDGISWSDSENRVDYGIQYNHRLNLLRTAFGRFTQQDKLDAFCTANGDWLPDFALFMALKDKFQGKPWYQWEKGLKFREPEAIWQARHELKEQIRFYSFVQYLFFGQWNALHSYAKENSVKIIGDVPFYVPYDSVELWTAPELFQLNADLEPTAVAGCPPDAFSDDGQLWGNPLYRWDVMAKDSYGWWIRRLAAAGKLYDVIRLDHFRGFESYWSVPYGDEVAKNGKWIKGPDMDFIQALKAQLPKLELIAEDLGLLTQAVLDLRDQSGFPGMKILGFAFDSREPSDYLPYKFGSNAVCYTGTHDNMTTRQWFETASDEAVEYAKEYMALTEEEGLVWGVIRTAMSSVADLCVVPMQDYLNLGGEARMNFPGTLTTANWTWRADAGFASKALQERIRKMTVLYGRTENKQ
ncbi:MAG: 4-alpha-glucanotransferase [Ruminococcaceae bacterium]|nr:4-alpha-glucanotransferase [Oscillospiraceae bacterium]